MSEMTYTMNGDFLFPNLTVKQTEKKPLGKYGRMHRAYLKQHQPIYYEHLIMTESLFPHLQEIDETANRRLEQMMSDLLKQNPAPDKAKDQMAWVRHMNMLKAQAEEVIFAELIYR